jgi:ankyrin repeat protein
LRESPQVRSLLAQHDVKLTDPASVGTPLLAQNLGDLATVRALLAAGSNPNERVPVITLSLPTLAVAASSGSEADVRLLLSSGANPNDAGTHGWTPLMFAAGSPRPNPAVIRALIDAGARLDARDDVGRTATDWAILQGDTPMVRQLKSAGGQPMAPAAPPPPAVAVPRTAAAAVERALARLQPTGPTFNAHTKCISCHHQSLPALAVKRASARGVRVDAALASHPTEASLASWRGMREQFLLGNSAIGGFIVNTSYGLWAMAEENAPADEVTDAVTLLLAAMQMRDGSWNIPVGNAGGGLRPPLAGGDPIHVTAIVARALSVYATPGARRDVQERIARAREFMRKATPEDTQGEVFKLLGLIWTKGTAAEISAQADRVARLQRGDGGWAQQSSLTSDAYATGQALFALHEAGANAAAPAFRKGAEFLLRTQLEDGTWFVQSRGFGFQPYFETGFPHGRSQFISAAATAWASAALAAAIP